MVSAISYWRKLTALQPPPIEEDTTPKAKFDLWSDLAAFSIQTVLALLVTMPILLDVGNLPGVDTYFHVFHLDYVTQSVKDGLGIPNFSPFYVGGQSFYIGNDTSRPGGAYLLALPLNLILNNASLTYALGYVFILNLGSFGFYMGFKNQYGRPAALLGSIAALFSPFMLASIDVHGRWIGLLAAAFLPVLFAGTIGTLRKPSRTLFALIAVSFGFAFVIHAMVLLQTLFVLGAYVVFRAFVSPTPMGRYVTVALAMATGATTAWILVPGQFSSILISQISGIGNTISTVGQTAGGRAAIVGAEGESLFSITLNSFSPTSIGDINYAGLGLLIISSISIVLRPSRTLIAIAAGTFVGYMLAFGNATPLYGSLPLSSLLEPRRFLFGIYILQGMLIGAALSTQPGLIELLIRLKVRGWLQNLKSKSSLNFSATLSAIPSLSILFILLLAIDSVPMSLNINPVDRKIYRDQANQIEQFERDGSTIYLPNFGFPSAHFNSTIANVDSFEGGRQMIQYDQLNLGEVARNLLITSNTSFAQVDMTITPRLAQNLIDKGWVPIQIESNVQLLANPSSSALVDLQHSKVLIAGSQVNPNWLRFTPNAIASSSNISALDSEFIRQFDLLILSGYTASDVESAEEKLLEFANAGGTIILEQPRIGGLPLFNQHISNPPIAGNVTGTLPDETSFTIEREGSDGRVLSGLQSDSAGEITLTGVDGSSGRTVPLVQEKIVGDGKFIFVCCGLASHAFQSRDTGAIQVIEHVLSQIPVNRTVVQPEDAPVTNLSSSDQFVRFDISVSEETAVVVPYRGGNNWVSTIDGVSVDNYVYGLGTLIVVPAGSHSVDLSFQRAAVPLFSVLVTLVGAGLAFGSMVTLWPLLSRVQLTDRNIFSMSLKWITAKGRSEKQTKNSRMHGKLEITGSRVRTSETPDTAVKNKAIYWISITNRTGSLVAVNLDSSVVRGLTVNNQIENRIDPTELAHVPFDPDRTAEAPKFLWGSVELATDRSIEGYIVFRSAEQDPVRTLVVNPQFEVRGSFD